MSAPFAPVSRDGYPLNDAIGRPNTRVVKRSEGKSAVAAAAYQARANLDDERTGERFDYSWRDDLETVEIHGWDGDISSLWNAAETRDARKNIQPARSSTLPLPADLSGQGRAELVRRYSQWLHNEYGIAVMSAIHRPDGYKRDPDTGAVDQGNRNWHAHLLETTWRVEAGADGTQRLGKKARELSDLSEDEDGKVPAKENMRKRRDVWCEMMNDALEAEQIPYRVDFSSYAEQVEEGRRAPQEPTQHLGPDHHRASRAAKGTTTRKNAENKRRQKRNSAHARAVQSVLDGAMPIGTYAASVEDQTERDLEEFFRKIQWSMRRVGARQKSEALARERAAQKTHSATPKTDEQKKEERRRAAIARRANKRRKPDRGHADDPDEL